MTKIPNVYCVIDTDTDEIWMTPKGKMTWNAPGHAKNAWNEQRYPKWGKDEAPVFTKQTRFVVKKCTLTITAEES